MLSYKKLKVGKQTKLRWCFRDSKDGVGGYSTQQVKVYNVGKTKLNMCLTDKENMLKRYLNIKISYDETTLLW